VRGTMPGQTAPHCGDPGEKIVKQIGWQGVSFGSALAMAISFNVNQSIGWAILHGLLSWFYVIYFAVFK
jgi:hypothetical protein